MLVSIETERLLTPDQAHSFAGRFVSSRFIPVAKGEEVTDALHIHDKMQRFDQAASADVIWARE